MTDDFTCGFWAGALVFTFFLAGVCVLTPPYEREQWCAHLHESYKAVEQCKVSPDWKAKKGQ